MNLKNSLCLIGANHSNSVQRVLIGSNQGGPGILYKYPKAERATAAAAAPAAAAAAATPEAPPAQGAAGRQRPQQTHGSAIIIDSCGYYDYDHYES